MDLTRKASIFTLVILGLFEVSSAQALLCKECPNFYEIVVSLLASIMLLTGMALILACFHCCRLPHGRKLTEYVQVPCKPSESPKCPEPPKCKRRCGTPISRSIFINQPVNCSRSCGIGCTGGRGCHSC